MRVGYWHMISLCTVGNAFLQRRLHSHIDIPRPTGIDRVSFYSGRIASTVLASSEGEWFKYLVKSGCKGIKMYTKENEKKTYIPTELIDYVGHGFMSAIYSDYVELWVSSFKVFDRSGVKVKWALDYGFSRAQHKHIEAPAQDLDLLAARLNSTLRRIGQFAKDIGMERWKEFFDRGIDVLEAESDVNSPSMFIPDVYSIIARKLLVACERSWVFGGMGSWLDEPEYYAEKAGKREEYNKLTDELFILTKESMEEAVNSFVLDA